MIGVVVKRFNALGQMLAPGAVVVSTGWRNEKRLYDNRFLRTATQEEEAQAVTLTPREGPAADTKKAVGQAKKKKAK